MSASVLMSFAKHFLLFFSNSLSDFLLVAECVQDRLGQVMELGLPSQLSFSVGHTFWTCSPIVQASLCHRHGLIRITQVDVECIGIPNAETFPDFSSVQMFFNFRSHNKLARDVHRGSVLTEQLDLELSPNFSDVLMLVDVSIRHDDLLPSYSAIQRRLFTSTCVHALTASLACPEHPSNWK